MSQNFLPCDREQVYLLPPSLEDWLPEEHWRGTVLEAVEELDLVDFYRPTVWMGTGARRMSRR
jgi:hypothetical protein